MVIYSPETSNVALFDKAYLVEEQIKRIRTSMQTGILDKMQLYARTHHVPDSG
ncbi:MAG: hypothetical protein H6Q26_1621 [Bacteroidetes bacterium]|nr:hypothetical protein [Bacteroidota bacterium]